MKQKILQILNNKKNNIKFKSKLFADEFEHSNLEDLRYYLWLCELEKWIFDNYKYYIEILTSRFYLDHSNYISSVEINYYYKIYKIKETRINQEFINKNNLLFENHIDFLPPSDKYIDYDIFHSEFVFIDVSNDKYNYKEFALETAIYDILNIIIKENE